MGTYIDTLEMVIETVSDYAVSAIVDVTAALAPDGRGFGQELQSEEAQIEDYMKLRGDALAWGDFIFSTAQQIEQKLAESAVSPDLIASVHPFDIAQKYAIQYSADMERKLTRAHGLLQDSIQANTPEPLEPLPSLAEQAGVQQ